MSGHLLSFVVAAPALAALVVMLLPREAKTAIRVTSLVGALASLAITVATVTAGSARSHSDWFVVQCACLTVASLGLRAVGRA